MKPDYSQARISHLAPELWPEVRALFEDAIGRDPEERRAFIDDVAATRPQIASEVRALLAAWDDRTESFVDSTVQLETAASTLKIDGLTSARIGPYVLRHELGRGGMGVVYLAEDTRLSRRVALKAIRPDLATSDEQRERLRREARAAAALSHPGIATVYTLEEIDNALYISTEFVAGRTLRAMLQDGPLPAALVVDAAAQVARVLAAAHAQGIVHRDLKPENVMRTAAGVIKVLDFGVARLENVPASRLTDTGTVVGTPAYMAPEQLLDEKVDFRADLFSFGVLLYELASGSNPFEAATLTATVGNVLQAQPVRLSSSGKASPALDRVIETCLAKRPDDRYRSTDALVADLDSIGTDVLERPSSRAMRRESSQIPRARSGFGPRWWWQFHQLIVSAIYVLTIYPAWRARVWMPQDCGMPFFFLILASAAVATTLRLNLGFTARAYPAELQAQRLRAGPWIKGSDIGFAVTLLLGALAIASRHPEIATVFVTIGVVSLAASLVIEPTATRVAFKRRSGAIRTPKRDA